MFSERKSVLLILAATFLWGLDLVVRYPVTLQMSYVSIVFLESLIGLLFISPWLISHFGELKKLSKSDWFIALFIGGIGMTACGYLQTVGIQKATPGLFSFFQIFQPLFVIYMAHLILKEKMDNMYLYWGIWAVLSAVLMFSVDLGIMLSSEIIFSDIMIALSSMLIWGFCTILGKKFLTHHAPATLVALRWLFGFTFAVIILIFEGERIPTEVLFQSDVWPRFIFMGVVAGIGSMCLYYTGLKQIAAGKSSLIELSYSASGMIFSAIYTFEGLSFIQLIGSLSFFAFIALFTSRQEGAAAAVGARKLR